MRNDIFKLSTLAALVLASTNANAAIYKIVEIESYQSLIPDSVRIDSPQYQGTYGSAISEDTILTSTQTCFDAGIDCTDSAISKNIFAGESIKAPKGYNYRQEAPFGTDNEFIYNTLEDLDNYCDTNFGFATCGKWAALNWSGISSKNVGGLERELNAWDSGYSTNASAFTEDNSPSVVEVITTVDASADPLGGSDAPLSDTKDIVINSLRGTISGTITAIGNSSSGFYNLSGNNGRLYRNRGFYNEGLGKIQLLPRQSVPDDDIVQEMGRTTAFDSFEFNSKTYVVGSAAVASYDTSVSERSAIAIDTCREATNPGNIKKCQSFAFAMKPYVWQVSGLGSNYATGNIVSPWTGIGDAGGADTMANSRSNGASGMGSVKGAIITNASSNATYNGRDLKGKPVLVGYNTENVSNYLKMQAAVFYPVDADIVDPSLANQWETKFITNATYNVGGSAVHSNSIAKDINDKLLVIGEAKRLGSVPENGSANNRLFVADASSGAPVANFLTGGIFFSGAGGEANAINNFNIIVGQIDAETSREVDGKDRRTRGFVYPYSGAPVAISSIFNDKAWWIDDLTNGGTYSSNNNKYRIINASDINDAGVIAATAIKCTTSLTSDVAVEYESTAHNAYCGADASGIEKIVSVKLVPLPDGQRSISTRSTAKPQVTRKGAGFGLLTLTALALISFRRRK